MDAHDQQVRGPKLVTLLVHGPPVEHLDVPHPAGLPEDAQAQVGVGGDPFVHLFGSASAEPLVRSLHLVLRGGLSPPELLARERFFWASCISWVMQIVHDRWSRFCW